MKFSGKCSVKSILRFIFRFIPGSFTFPTINGMTMLFHDLKQMQTDNLQWKNNKSRVTRYLKLLWFSITSDENPLKRKFSSAERRKYRKLHTYSFCLIAELSA